jgi:uncharacterized protein Veg
VSNSKALVAYQAVLSDKRSHIEAKRGQKEKQSGILSKAYCSFFLFSFSSQQKAFLGCWLLKNGTFCLGYFQLIK